jgi:ubiquinone/menaquinone biosynthesis C-methylase UbiE
MAGAMDAIEYGGLSQWRETATLDETRARALVDRLELRASAQDERDARAEYLGLLGLKPGARVLDVGCGSGVVARDAARLVAPDGRVVAIDTSAALLAIAQKLVAADGLDHLVEPRAADCRALPFGDESFDVTVAATVLAHVPDAGRALHEMVRVTRRGGRVGVFDFDSDSFLLSHPDRATTRRILNALSDHGAVNGWLVRHLPGLLGEAGLGDIGTRAFMPLERDPGSFSAKLAERAAELAEQVGAVTPGERAAWVTALAGEQRAGRFMAGRLHIFVWGVRR